MNDQSFQSQHRLGAKAGAMLLAAVQALCGLPMLAHAAGESGSTAIYRNDRFGFSFSYPNDLLVPDPKFESDAGTVLVSPDGRVRLVASAGPNTTDGGLDTYRKFVMTETYAGAKIGYAPVRSNWFVVAGEKDGHVFYERITFACNGARIYGWQMTYPVAERATFDAIVERIHKTYRPRSGDDGACK